ncbi:MAG: DUF1080 domain-containing protein [Nitrospiraceae bacterium]|nr:DUF1080 domain-containing protein [Nitrospiraceae bacterium]
MWRTMGVALMLGMLLGAGFVCQAEEDLIQGNWEGAFKSKKLKSMPVAARVVAQGRDAYRCVLIFGEGGDAVIANRIKGEAQSGKAEFSGAVDTGAGLGGRFDVKVKIAKGKLQGKFSGKGNPGSFQMTRVLKKSPTLGAKAPAGAVVLFDGTSTDAWQFKKQAWEIVDGAMEVREGSMYSKESFGDAKLHVEFRTPFMPKARGQARGNSGVYVQGRYEIQVLDCFGLPPADNGSGGIYKVAVPKVNACLPPGEWQTYDITFTAPRFDGNGNKTADAVISVEYNGILIHDKVVLGAACGGGLSGEETAAGPLMLQDHHNPVQYRNIWVLPR